MKIKDTIVAFCAVGLLCACNEAVDKATVKDVLPSIYPDYVGVTIPATIAPLNFGTAGESEKIDVCIRGVKGEDIHVQEVGDTDFPQQKWNELLQANRGDSVMVSVSIKQGESWTRYREFPIYISKESIDYGVAYRLIAPGYEVYSKMGIYQRCLSNFKQDAVLENTQVTGSCMNCHTANRCNPQDLSLHIRGSHGATILRQGNKESYLDTKTDSTINGFVYSYWHPSGKYLAYSLNTTRQAFHVVHDERVEVFDHASDVIVYDVSKKQLLKCPRLTTDNFETAPSFSPDGRTLYFASSKPQEFPLGYKQVRYDLCSISFDAEKGTFGAKVDTLFAASKMGKSVSFPKPSYDGRYILFSLMDYGNFSIWHKEADLWVYDLKQKRAYPLTALNSDNTEGYHNWSSNSKWIVFISRRDNGLYSRLYIASANKDGSFGKPFMLPQQGPSTYYDELFYSYNVPDFITSPIEMDARATESKIVSDERLKVGVRSVR